MTNLDTETKSRIEAEERFRAQIRRRERDIFPSYLSPLLSSLGGLMIIIGAFLPAISVPMVGTVDLFGNGSQYGWILVILGFTVALLSLIKVCSDWSVVPSVLAGGITYWIYFNINQSPEINTMGLSGLIQFQIGWFIVGAGILLTIVIFLAGGWRTVDITLKE